MQFLESYKILGRVFLFLCLQFLNTEAFAQLSANFSSDATKGCAPLVVTFKDLSTGSPTSWRWDLGNGNVSTQQNPNTIYFNPGTYTVRLTVRTSTGVDSVTKVDYITVNNSPVVDFSSSVTTGCFPLNVQFTDKSTPGSGTITSRVWDFGDGIISTDPSPSHTYKVAGTFTIALSVTNSNGCSKISSKVNLISIQGGVKADFTLGPIASCNPPVQANFTNTSTGVGIISNEWLFGDGSTSTATNPSHNYTTAGSYSVSLVVKTQLGCVDTMTKNNIITLGASKAALSGPDETCIGTPAKFLNASTPGAGTSFWTFGDGTTSTEVNPVKYFTTTGTFTVKLVNGAEGCKDSASKQIRVLPKPVSSFNVNSSLGGCAIPATVSFSSTANNAVKYQWNFGDSSTSDLPNPTHVYTSAGSYTVTLIITNASGCSDTLVKPNLLNFLAPVINSLGGIPYKGCAPHTANLSANISSPDPVATYLWSFGDGTTSALANPSHTYSTTGTYDITLTITTANGCSVTKTFTEAIKIDPQPVPKFSADPTNACAWKKIEFTNLSTGQITEYIWDFGDGGSSNEKNPVHQYKDTGYFTVTLTLKNNGCEASVIMPKYIYINPPVARFNIDLNCNDPFFRTYTDKSVAATEWKWDLGDGTTSTLQNPQHRYQKTGQYVVKLEVKNNTCADTTQTTVFILDEKITLTTTDSVKCNSTAVTFNVSNVNMGNVASYKWEFGDGSTSSSTSSPVTHTYKVSGNYTASLVVMNNLGCTDTATKNITVKVFGPTAAFTSPPGSCLNDVVTFTDQSKIEAPSTIKTYIWNYGDSSIESSATGPFTHKYTKAGTYNLTLKVIADNGCIDSIVKTKAIIITDPVADFALDDSIGCANSAIQFKNTSKGLGLTNLWNFGDGSTSTDSTPSYRYASNGYFTVSLNVTDRFGCKSSVTKPNALLIDNVKADFKLSDSNSACPPVLITLISTSTNASSLSWNFDDGGFSNLDSPSHFFSIPRIYNIKLKAFGYGSCTDSIIKTVNLRGPEGNFIYDTLAKCAPATVRFEAHAKNNDSFIWDFGDGNTSVTEDSIITHVYKTSGKFIPNLLLVNRGCKTPLIGTSPLFISGVQARMDTITASFCDSGTVQFKSNSLIQNDVISSLQWDFGDGTISNLQNPSHIFTTAGKHAVKLIVTSQNGCSDTTNASTITINTSPKFNFTGDTVACINQPVNLGAALLQPDTSRVSWKWDFGNGVTSSNAVPAPQTYPLPGNYTITASVTNAANCITTASTVVKISGLPIVNAGTDTTICRGQSFILNPSGANTYQWNYDTSLSCTLCTNPVAKPNTNINYVVTGITNIGCRNTDTVAIQVIQPFKMTTIANDTLCVGETANLWARGAERYAWSPAETLDNPNSENPVAKPLNSTVYTVVGFDRSGCFTDTALVPVIVYTKPVFNIVPDKITLAVGNQVTLTTTNSPDVNRWRWLPPMDLSCYNCAQPVVTGRTNITYKAIATNLAGCTAEDNVTIQVFCNNGNVYIPNTFSPNNDGMNDVFYIRGKGIAGIKSLRIFNRWGTVVFSKLNLSINEPGAGWDGRYNGQPLTPDVFVYEAEIICDNNEVFPMKGNVTLIK